MRRTLTVFALAAALPLAAAATAHAGGLYYPKRAYFTMKVQGTQTTTVDASARCPDAAGNEVSRQGQLTEKVTFTTRRAGIVLFKTDGKGGVDLFQESDDFEDGVRPVLARGSIERASTLSRNGRTVADCDGAPPAEGCGTNDFASWRMFLFGRGRKVAVGLGSNGAAGGDPFPSCSQDSLFPDTFQNRPAKIARGLPFKRKRISLSAQQTKTTQFDNAFENTSGTVTRSIQWKATLVRKGPVTRGGQPIR